MDNVGDKLKEYFKHKEITQEEVGRSLGGISQSYVGNILNGKRGIGKSMAEKFNKAYGFSVAWLRTGEGSMFPDTNVRTNNDIPIKGNATPAEMIVTPVPLVPYGARAGSLSEFEDLFEEDKNRVYMVYHTAEERITKDHAVFHVEGESMMPEFLDGDMVLAKYLDPINYKDYRLNLRSHRYWVIITEKGVIVKNIIDHNVMEKTIECHSINPQHEDFTLSLTEVFKLYYIESLVGRKY